MLASHPLSLWLPVKTTHFTSLGLLKKPFAATVWHPELGWVPLFQCTTPAPLELHRPSSASPCLPAILLVITKPPSAFQQKKLGCSLLLSYQPVTKHVVDCCDSPAPIHQLHLRSWSLTAIFQWRVLKTITLPPFSCHSKSCVMKTFTLWIYFRILSIFINKSNECSFYTAVIHPHCCSRAYYLIYIFKCFSKCRISGLESKTFHFFVLRPTQSTSKVRYGVDFQQQTCLHGIWKPV